MNEPLDLHLRPSLAAGVRLQNDRVTGEPMLLSSEGVLILNDTSRALVERCDGRASIDAIAESLAAEYEADADELRADVIACLRDLHARRLVVLAP